MRGWDLAMRAHLAVGSAWNCVCVCFGLSHNKYSGQLFLCWEQPCEVPAQVASPCIVALCCMGFSAILPGRPGVNCVVQKNRQISDLLPS